ncbi:MAG: hypothetical protein R6W06_10045 [Prochlorococcaceae cyanobacterium]
MHALSGDKKVVCTIQTFLSDPAHSSHLEEVYGEARANFLWAPLETVLANQPPSTHGPLDLALRDYILLITILMAFLEATAQQLWPMQPPVVMGFSGITLSLRRTSRRSPQRARPRKGCARQPSAGDGTPRALGSVSAAAGP